MSCELCYLIRGNIITKFYYRNSEVMIVDCATCKIPMLVFKKHGEISEDEKRRALAVINALFEYESIRTEARRIKEHEHWHIESAKLR